ncbi:MAG TPA: T9SS type A sorting domain-containing protein, partial [Chitinophagales bacterium]|nr:T9SS type A sorting domain-containing protein [Chitinophagales bacterium]
NINLGDTFYFELTQLTPGKYYSIMVTSVDTAFRESAPSNKVSFYWNSNSILNNAPTIEKPLPLHYVEVGGTFTYPLSTTDPDNDPLTFNLDGPAGLSYANSTFTWTPVDSALGYHQIYLTATDPSGLKDSVFFQIIVLNSDMKQAVIEFSKVLYQDYNDKGVVLISDFDFDGNPLEIDNISVRIYSDTDQTGITLTAQETEASSRIFSARFEFTQSGSSGNRLKVSAGNRIWAEYNDASASVMVKQWAYFTEFTARFLSADTVCAGDLVKFENKSHGSGMLYAWDFGDAATSTEKHPSHAFLLPLNAGIQPFSVSLTIRDEEGRSSSFSKTIYVVAPLDVNLVSSDSTTFCEDNSIDLLAPAGMKSYLWSTGAATAQITVYDADSFYATVTDMYGCEHLSDTIHTTVIPNPVIMLAQTTDSIGCESQTITLSSSGADTYEWKTRDGALVGTGDTLVINTTESTTYYVTGHSGICYRTDSIVIHVVTNPSVEINLTDTTICRGQSVRLEIADSIPYAHIWSPNKWLSTSTGAVVTATPDSSITYTVRIQTYDECYVEESISITVIDTPAAPVLIQEGTLLTVDPVVPGYTYQWYRNGSVIEGDTGSSITVDSNAYYSVKITDPNGCSSVSGNKYVTVGISSIGQAIPFNIYPNPAGDWIHIELEFSQAEDFSISIFNINGKLVEQVREENYSGQYRKKIDLRDYSEGVYIITVVASGGTGMRKFSIHK